MHVLDRSPPPTDEGSTHSNNSFRRAVRKKQSMPALSSRRAASPLPDLPSARTPSPPHTFPVAREPKPYRPNPKDPLDVHVASIINASPIAIKCQRGPQEGRYYFGNELNPSVGGGKKLYTCKLMSYDGRRGSSDKARSKVLVRVGGGWQDLELFLLHYGILH